VTLVAALAAPIVHAVSLARSRAAAAAEEGLGPVRLLGSPAAPGTVIGTIAFARGPAPRKRHDSGPSPASVEAESRLAGDAIAATIAALSPLARACPEVESLLCDRRLSERTRELCAGGASAARALDRVARESARIAELAGDITLRKRAVDIEGLCDRAAARVLGQAAPIWAPGTVLVTHRLSSWDALELAAAGGIGFATSSCATESPGLAIARRRGLAACSEIGALFRWARAGARILVDGDTGVVVVNPGRAEVASYRAARKRQDGAVR
jgi:phosphotransferase system enzyme I (PtsP)